MKRKWGLDTYNQAELTQRAKSKAALSHWSDFLHFGFPDVILKNSFYYLSYKAHLKGLVFWSRLFQCSISDHFLSTLDLLYVTHLPYFLWAYFLSIFPPSVVLSQCFRTSWALGQHCWLTLTSYHRCSTQKSRAELDRLKINCRVL